jgi:hypothetical protein
MTLATGTTTPTIYGNWINGTGTTLSGTGILTFAGRTSQTITSAGKTFTQPLTINSLAGTVTLQDAFTTSFNGVSALQVLAGTFNANVYNVSLSGATSTFVTSGTLTRTIAIGSGAWALAGSGNPWNSTGSNVSVTGTGTISLTSASAKSFTGLSLDYSGITINQGGAGALTFGGNNILKTITNTYKSVGATSILFAATVQTLTSAWNAFGESGRLLSISGTSAVSPATLIFTGSANGADVDYLSISNVRAYTIDTWYAGVNSTNLGSLGWLFSAAPIITANYLGNFFAFF